MFDTLYVTEINPHVFIEKLVENIKAGYYVTDTITGIPTLDLINEVELTRTDKPSQRTNFDEYETVVVSSYSDLLFLLDIQDAVLQGFEVVPGTFDVAPPHAPHQVSLVRAEAKPEKEAVKDAPRKGGRPPKVKEL